MIVAKFLNNVHNLVEQKDIKETVLFKSKTNVGYTHDVTLSEDPSNYDYLIILVTSGSSDSSRICYAKKHGDIWYTNSSSTDYRNIYIAIGSQSGTSMRINVAEWVSKSLNYGCAIDCIIGVNRGGSLAKILNWLAPRRKVVLAC